ncbi:ABC transporter permease [Mycobacterium sp. NAZ190054]|uniref:ABC transporter permease n=1 Tax=Mycobacterium sp. NAZ190054 TaxID=1747766 RepID=UPI00079159BC|nr:ABC transporter permease [Mycobacterium sp. NAZ190054]KWX63201.1 ABC transporter permease [Mycobacterium sp. NAZ190054]
MRAVAAVDAERVKLTTLRSPLWAALAAMVLSCALAALQTSTAYGYARLSVPEVALGVAVFGIPVLMIVAAMTVTGEYRTGLIAVTWLATPDRTLVMCAKAVVAAVFSAVSAAVMVLGSVSVARLVAAPGVADALTVPATVRFAAAVALYAVLAAVLGVGVATLLRHTAGAVTVLLLWPLLVEPLLANLPGRGWQIGPYLPFGNAMRFLDVQWLYPGFAMHWGTWGSLGYFAAVVVVVFVAALISVNRRDA